MSAGQEVARRGKGDGHAGSWRRELGRVTGLLRYRVFQNGRFLGDADLERQKYPDLKLNGPQVREAEVSGCGQPACWGCRAPVSPPELEQGDLV